MIKISIKDKIKDYFMQNPTVKLRVRQIEREIDVPLPSAIRYAKELAEENILRSEDISGITFYSADRNSVAFLINKRTYNLLKINDSGLLDHLKDVYDNANIVLFGSYSKGEDTEKSDIDLYLEYPTGKKTDLSDYERKTDRKIQLFIHKNIQEIKNKELANNIMNGITLNGFVEVFR